MRQHEQNQPRPAAGLVPEHFDLRAKIGVGAGLNNSSINARCRPIASVICARFMAFAVASPACQAV